VVVRRPVTRSVAEVQALVQKAARGAGLPLGTAEELYQAVPYALSLGVLPALVSQLKDLRELSADVDDAQAEGRDVQGLMQAMLAARGAVDVTPAKGPQELDQSDLETLERWAAKTFVPESEASRQAGAGAGLTDND